MRALSRSSRTHSRAIVAPDLPARLAQIESDHSLFESDQLRRRMEILEELDSSFADTKKPSVAAPAHGRLFKRVKQLRSRLEAANAAIYHSIRGQIRGGAAPDCLLMWIESCRDPEPRPRPGLSYDHLDELISGVLQLREPENAPAPPGPEMVFYQPTPVRHILGLVAAARPSASDVLVDLGSGLGHVAILASILTGACTIGIESEAAYVLSARGCASSLGLGRVSFIHQDAREADFSSATIFYLYTPFTGAILASVIGKLRQESTRRPIRICSLGPCSLTLGTEPWLKAESAPKADRIANFHSIA